MTNQNYSQTGHISVEASSIQTNMLLDASYHKLKKGVVRLMFYCSTKSTGVQPPMAIWHEGGLRYRFFLKILGGEGGAWMYTKRETLPFY